MKAERTELDPKAKPDCPSCRGKGKYEAMIQDDPDETAIYTCACTLGGLAKNVEPVSEPGKGLRMAAKAWRKRAERATPEVEKQLAIETAIMYDKGAAVLEDEAQDEGRK